MLTRETIEKAFARNAFRNAAFEKALNDGLRDYYADAIDWAVRDQKLPFINRYT
jgi:hypothetical protein